MDDVGRISLATDEISISERSWLMFFVRQAIIFVILISVVDLALFQLEMWATGGNIPFHPSMLTLLTAVCSLPIVLKYRVGQNSLIPAVGLLCGYILIDAMVLITASDLSLREVRGSFSFIVMILLVSIAPSFDARITDRDVYPLLLIFFVTCGSLTLLQYVMNDPIVSVVSNDRTLSVPSYIFQGHVRGFGFCVSAFQAGLFYCFTACVGVALWKKRRQKFYGGALLLVSVACCWATLTRLVFLALLFSVISTFLLGLKLRLKMLKVLIPLVGLLLGMVIFWQGAGITGGSGRTDIMSTGTLNQRIVEDGFYALLYAKGSVRQILLGQGMAPWTERSADRLSNAAPIEMDNAYLQILLSIGLVGLLVVGVVLSLTWLKLLRRAERSSSAITLAAAGVFSAIPFIGVIDGFPIALTLLAAIPLCYSDKHFHSQEDAPSKGLVQL
jgi:hypothetical protein